VFDIPTTELSSAQPSQAEQIHTSLCTGCHDQPRQDVERPAYNVYDEAEKLSTEEFTARIMVGVKGDVATGIDNPLTDIELVNLIRYYKTKRAQ